MSNVLEFFAQRWHEISNVIMSFSIGDALDILAFAFLMYQGIRLVRETRGGQLVKGIIFILIAYFVSGWLKMNMMNWLIERIIDIGFIALIVLFQPELRRILEQLGRTGKFKLLGKNVAEEESIRQQKRAISEICKACSSMSDSKTGALIVIERETMLGDVIDTGCKVDAVVSEELLGNLFFNKAPLHDGGVIIRNNRVQAAACILPLTKNNSLNNELGTRHRAGIGMSEESDAVVIIVSEETGNISVAIDGRLRRDFDAITLQTELEKDLIVEDNEETKKGIASRFKEVFKWDKK